MLDTLELVLWIGLNHHVGAETQTLIDLEFRLYLIDSDLSLNST